MQTIHHHVARRSAFTLVALMAILIVPSAIAGGEPESGPVAEPLRIIYPKTVSSIPFLVAIEENADRYSGEFYSDHPQALAQLLAGDADVLATGFSLGLSRYQAAGDLVHVGTTVWGVSALMTSEEIDSWSDLAGGQIYAPFEGSPIDVFIKSMLELEGLVDQVEIRYAPFPQSAALVAQGDAGAAILVEPIASALEMNGQAYRLENIQDGWARITGGEPRSPQISLFTLGETADARLADLKSLRSDVQAAALAIMEDTGTFASDYSAAIGSPAPVLRNSLMNTLMDAPDAEVEREVIELYIRLVGEPLPGDDFHLDAR